MSINEHTLIADGHYLRLHYIPFQDQIGGLLYRRKDQKIYFATPEFEFIEKTPGCPPHQPTFHLEGTDAQRLMDDLWNCGIRPTEGKGSAGAMAATQFHLEDMRKLVFEFDTRKK